MIVKPGGAQGRLSILSGWPAAGQPLIAGGRSNAEGVDDMNRYEPGQALDRCRAADRYWLAGELDRFFEEYLRIATETSYPLAECQVGFCYLEGHGVAPDPEKALYWSERAARCGDRDAQFNLAWIYESGICGAPDHERAKYWYAQSARQGLAMAQDRYRKLCAPPNDGG